MWVLIYWICTANSCATNYVPGFFEQQKECESVAMTMVKGPSQRINPDITKDAQCVLASNFTFE